MKHVITVASLSLLSATLASSLSAAPATPDSDMAGVLSQLQKLDPKPIETLTAKEARKQPTPADAVKAYLKANDIKASPEKVGDVDNRSIDGPGGNIKIRVYTPKGDGPFPVIVYYHGGGFVIADLDTYDSTPRALSNATNAVVVSSHYRQAPEHKFPASHEDAFATYRWVLSHAREIKGDANRVAVAGESAGGNLAAAVCLMAKEQHVALPVHQLLVYPVTDNDMETPSYKENADAKPLSKAMMAWFFKNEAAPSDANDPRLALLKKADVKGMPPATVITAQIDPLRSEGEAFAQKLKAAGVPVNYRNFDGATHEFFGMSAAVAKAKEAVTFAATDLNKAFSKAPMVKAAE
ncbi:MAG: alpha/beta hydrolase [Opitutus sp.]